MGRALVLGTLHAICRGSADQGGRFTSRARARGSARRVPDRRRV